MNVFKLKISHTTHSSLASNINITKNLYLDPPNIKFVLDYTDSYGDISEEGVRKLVEPNVTSIITGARIVMISNGIISEVTKSKYLEELSPQREITHEKIKTTLGDSLQLPLVDHFYCLWHHWQCIGSACRTSYPLAGAYSRKYQFMAILADPNLIDFPNLPGDFSGLWFFIWRVPIFLEL